MSEPLAQIERSADRIRGELVETLQELDRRRQRAMDVRYQLSKHIGLVMGAAAAVVGLVAAGVVVQQVRSKTARTRRARDRARGLMRAWDHPRQIANQRPGHSLPVEVARRVTLIVVSALATQLAHRAAQRYLPT